MTGLLNSKLPEYVVLVTQVIFRYQGHEIVHCVVPSISGIFWVGR